MPEYPYKERGERDALSERLMRSAAREPIQAGGKSPPRLVKDGPGDFASAGRLVTDSPAIRPPKWLRKALEENEPHDEVLRLVGRRLEGRVSEQRLQEALAVVNEIARRRDGTELVHKHLTQDRVDDLVGKGR